MAVTLPNAPLVEVIAELRWDTVPKAISMSPAGQLGPSIVQGDPNQFEQSYFAFAANVSKFGFTNVERLLQPTLPMFAYQPALRFREPGNDHANVLYQLGPGLFSANAVPPYKSWEGFSPVLINGVNAIMEARPLAERAMPMSTVSLRYINAFGPSLTQGMPASVFINDVLGFSVSLPASAQKLLVGGALPKPVIQVQLPLERGMLMNIAIGEGLTVAGPGVIMDTTVATSAPVTPDPKVIVETLTDEWKLIHTLFFDLTNRISESMSGAVS
jgi:uncharacterized protein (TIGR04255 family)